MLLPVLGLAQADSLARGSVSGTVYDSLARAPLSGANIQLVLAADLQQLRTAVSDGHGRFVIDDLPPGRYLIGFHHVVLDSVALEVAPRLVDVRAGERSKADLAVPSPPTIVTAACGQNGIADSTGLLIGMFRDAQRQQAFDAGTVKALWQEMIFSKTAVSSAQREATGTVNAEGWYAVCGVPGGVDVVVLGWHGADSTGIISASVPVGGLARLDLLVGGTAVVRGTVRSEKNLPLLNARVGIVGRERAVRTDSTGTFYLSEIPAGSSTLEVRALGYAPVTRPLALAAGADTTMAIGLTSVKRVLDTIQIVAQRLYNRDSNGFLRRMRLGGGYFFDQETVQKQHPFDVAQLLYAVPSIRQIQRGMTRSLVMRGGASGFCTPALFLDGARMPADLLGDLDMLVRPEELEGMEVYPRNTAPAQFSDFSGCGSIVVWTRVPPRRAK